MTTGGISRLRVARLHDVLERHIEAGSAPGLVSLICRRGEVQADAIGTLAGGGPDLVWRGTIFRVSSMTKPVTAAAAMICLEECLLRLDEPAARLLPELAGLRVLARPGAPLTETVPAGRPVTVRDLLTFRMGTGILPAPPAAHPVSRAALELDLGQHMPAPATPRNRASGCAASARCR